MNTGPTEIAFEKCPRSWIEQEDIENITFEKATWIPLLVEKSELIHGEQGAEGYRRAYRDVDSIVVPVEVANKFTKVDWQTISRKWPDAAWADNKTFLSPGCYHDEPSVIYPVIKREFGTGEPKQWQLHQELEVGLKLLRQGDKWICPNENDLEIAKLERNADGDPVALVIRAEHLRDYLCAKRAKLFLVAFCVRDAVEKEFPGITWPPGEQSRSFVNGNWVGQLIDIHEGGMPYGMTSAVIHVSRESVDPSVDVPEMPRPGDDPGLKSKTFSLDSKGLNLQQVTGRIWTKYWIEPAAKSPRIRGDVIESRVPFQVENQEQKTLAGATLEKYRGWLWFKPVVVRKILEMPKAQINWFTESTGQLGPASNQLLHFGINKLGLVNVLGRDMGRAPEWVQKSWVTENVSPDGGLSEELHMAQNLAAPAKTTAPESMLWHNLGLMQTRSAQLYGKPLLQHVPIESEFFRKIHRFYCSSFEEVCELCKELHKVVTEPIDVGLLNATIDPGNAVISNQQGLRQIKRLALWLGATKLDGRKVTQPLAGVADLRQGDAHLPGKDAKEALQLFGISKDCTDYQLICREIIGQVTNCFGAVADIIKHLSSA